MNGPGGAHRGGAVGSHDLTAAYAVDAVDERERALAEEHLAGCAACREEVAAMPPEGPSGMPASCASRTC
ncbi:zf-HC2 domain-containing protein, partial [Kineococcus glutinatus]|uniref:zf-HC2 domain-containing protein n=1 Tax=Kineococcus glutinatus TaxID=1070872 RepID=UPI0031E4F5B9